MRTAGTGSAVAPAGAIPGRRTTQSSTALSPCCPRWSASCC
jgi:hypothetical protein